MPIKPGFAAIEAEHLHCSLTRGDCLTYIRTIPKGQRVGGRYIGGTAITGVFKRSFDDEANQEKAAAESYPARCARRASHREGNGGQNAISRLARAGIAESAHAKRSMKCTLASCSRKHLHGSLTRGWRLTYPQASQKGIGRPRRETRVRGFSLRRLPLLARRSNSLRTSCA